MGAIMVQQPVQVQVTSCALGGHMLCCGKSFVRAIKKEMPEAQVTHKVGPPLSFRVAVNGKDELKPGVFTLLGGSSAKVAKEVSTKANSADEGEGAVAGEPVQTA